MKSKIPQFQKRGAMEYPHIEQVKSLLLQITDSGKFVVMDGITDFKYHSCTILRMFLLSSGVAHNKTGKFIALSFQFS